MRARKAKPDFTELIQIQILNDSQERAYQRKVTLDAMVEQAKDRKHMSQLMAAVATGFFKSNQNKKEKRKTKRDVGKKARKEGSSSISGSEKNSDTSGSVVEVEARVVKSVRESGGDDVSHPHRVFQHSAD